MQIGALQIDPATNSVRWQRNNVKLTPKVMEVLMVLVIANEAVISRDELLDTVWTGRVGADESLTRAISDIRKILKSLHSDAAKALVTIPKRGYQLKTSVLRQTFDGEPDRPPAEMAVRPHLSYKRGAAIVLAMIVAIVVGIALLSDGKANTSKPAIAVMPFVSLGDEARTGFLGQGIAEDILNQLTRSDGLTVISRTSSFALAERKLTSQEQAELLHADYLLEGSVRKSGELLRITTQLVDAESGTNVWSASYEKPLANVFSIQNEVSASISRALSLNTRPDDDYNSKAMTTNVAAYELFIKARELAYQRNTVSLRQAAGLLEQALLLDDTFHLARAQLFIIYELAVVYGGFDAETINAERERLFVELLTAPDFPLKKVVLAQHARENGQIALSNSLLQAAFNEAPAEPYIQNYAMRYARETMSAKQVLAERIKLLKVNPLGLANMANIIMLANQVGDDTLVDETLARMVEVDQNSMLTIGVKMTKYYSIERNPFRAIQILDAYSGPESARLNSLKLSMLIVSGQHDAALSLAERLLISGMYIRETLTHVLGILVDQMEKGRLSTSQEEALRNLPFPEGVQEEIVAILAMQRGDVSAFEQLYGVNGEITLARFEDMLDTLDDSQVLYAAIKHREGDHRYLARMLKLAVVIEMPCEDITVKTPSLFCIPKLNGMERNTDALFDFYKRSLNSLHFQNPGLEYFMKTSPLYYGADQHPDFEESADAFLNETFMRWREIGDGRGVAGLEGSLHGQ
ncbi:winged helix-turn-helix domain-containing protein [Alteromonas sp. CYL-A6]|uniref:winged helix-turn-helix domain-containing protein n=1 Tax=Alteromonas nitratireducens TaxID=3390813 RepID=UPI0034ADE9D0